MKIKHLLIMLCVLCASTVWAQEPVPAGGIDGRVVVREKRASLDGAKVTLMPDGLVRYSENGGHFFFEGLPAGQYTLKIEVDEFEDAEVNVRIAETVREVTIPMISTISIGGLNDLDVVDFDIEGGDDIQYSASSNLSSSKDLFSNIAGYKFSEMRFNARGLRAETVYLNGMEFNDALTGYSPWSLWTGLNDATRNQESQAGAGATIYGLGGVVGNTNINARASQMRQGFRGSLAGGTNSYLLRVMATYASGMLDNGWSYAVSASTRQGHHAYVDGVYYNTFGWFGSVEKRFNGGHNLAFTIFGAPTQRGAQAASTDEAYMWTGNSYYNPNWGYQDGKMRNARVRNNHEPVAMLNYTYNNEDKGITVNAGLSYRFGKNGYSALDWYNSKDPRPDYYRYLPSWYSPKYGRVMNLDIGRQYRETRDMWTRNDPKYTQIDWDDLINRNRNSKLMDGEIGPADDGRVDPATMSRSRFIIEERRTDQNDVQFNTRIEQRISPRSKMTYGINYRWNRTEYFKIVKDLLGGDYFIDIDNFADRDFPNGIETQNNLARPNRAVYEGDKFGYDYYAHYNKGGLWAMYNYTSPMVNFYGAFEGGFTNFWREGLVEKGLFPNHILDSSGNPVAGADGKPISVAQDLTSLGDSKHLDFFTYKAKAGASVSLSGAHNIALNVAYDNSAPYFQNAFVSPRTRNEVTQGLTTQKTLAVDLTYNMRYSWGRMRVAGYFMQLRDQSDVMSFYDDINTTFTNFAMSDIDQRHVGVEFAAQIPIAWGISFNTAVSYGNFVYTSNPRVTQTVDNSALKELNNAPVYYDGLNVENAPRFAANFGLGYRSGNNWFAGIDLNVYDGLYLSMNPLRRTEKAWENMDPNTEKGQQQFREMVAQEKFPIAFVVNANVGKLWYLSKGQLGFSLEAKNLLNNRNIRTGGYEQSRLWRLSENESTDPYMPFDSKYFYLYGVNFYLNVYYRF